MRYLDHAATTKMDNEVLEVYRMASERFFGNASSLHDFGAEASRMLENARGVIANTLSVKGDEIYFTSGGTEANQLAVLTLLRSVKKEGKHIITTSIEHGSLHQLFKKLAVEGYSITYLGVDELGVVSLDDLREALRDETVLVAVQHVNSEIGVVQNIQEMGAFLKEKGIYFHSDLVQSYGKIQLDLRELNITSGAISSHKIYGPKGMGAAFISEKISFTSFYPETSHEGGFRPGTVDVPSVLAFAHAAQLVCARIEVNRLHDANLRAIFVNRLSEYKDYILLHTHKTQQVDAIIGASIVGLQGQFIMLECNRYGFAISTGSACQVGKAEPSRMMLAMGKTNEAAKELFRISFGQETTEQDVLDLANVLIKILGRVAK